MTVSGEETECPLLFSTWSPLSELLGEVRVSLDLMRGGGGG